MRTPSQYQHELDEILGGDKSSPERLAEFERQLQLDIRALQTQFAGRAVSSLNQASKLTGKERAEAHDRLEEEKNRRLQPYRDLLEKVQKELEKK
jgi:hypothetical protein